MATPHIDRLLETMIRVGATDALVVPGVPPRVRVDGRERALETRPLSADGVLRLIKSTMPERGRADLEEHGRATWSFAYHDAARFRATAARQLDGHILALRCHPAKLRTLEELGLPPIIKALCRRPRGLFVVAGPASSGKTSVLATFIDYINRNFDRRIMTIEKPAEITHQPMKSTVVHREVGVHVPSYEQAITELRLDRADVALIGDLDDERVIRAALAIAHSDGLILAHMRARGTRNVVERLCAADGGRDPEHSRGLVAGSLLAVLYLELCMRSAGGMVPAYEFLIATPALVTLIQENKLDRIDAAIQTGRKYGMQLLDDHLFQLVRAGVIFADEALDKSRAPAALQARLNGQPPEDSADAPETAGSPVRPPKAPPSLLGRAGLED